MRSKKGFLNKRLRAKCRELVKKDHELPFHTTSEIDQKLAAMKKKWEAKRQEEGLVGYAELLAKAKNHINQTPEEPDETIPALRASTLPGKIEELRAFVLLNTEKLKAYRARVQAADKLDVAKELRDKAIEEGQILAEQVFYAEAKGERFYSHPSNSLYSPPLLKLHGSINWFIYSGANKYPFGDNVVAEEKKGKTLLFEGSRWFNEAPDLYGIIIEPIIITPVVHKQIHQTPIIPTIWQKAAEELAACKRLVVGGYSSPPTDFHTRRLFLEVFSHHSPEEIAIINPDTRIVQLVKDFCHFRKPVLACKGLDEFISSYR
ncbi:MAG: hypothetical protein ACXVB1_16760 [Pseudobdellovibrionaceae bacterium]